MTRNAIIDIRKYRWLKSVLMGSFILFIAMFHLTCSSGSNTSDDSGGDGGQEIIDAPVCGDGEITGDEVCDTNGNLLDGNTCTDMGYAGDGLQCGDDCLSFDISACDAPIQDETGCIPGDQSCMESFTLTRGAYSGPSDPAILIVDRLGWSSTDGDEGTGRGTFHWAVTRNYPRVVLFEVSGTIDMREVANIIAIENPYLTVAGQTAPSPGITIRGVATRINDTHDIIIKHLRFRLGEIHDDSRCQDVLHVNGASDVLIDHNTLSWSIDELSGHIGSSDINERITWTYNFFTEPLQSPSAHSGGEDKHNYAMITYYVDEVTIAKNLFAYSRDRNPMMRSGHSVIYNNLMYNQDKGGVTYNVHSNGPIDRIISCYMGNAIIPFDDSHFVSPYAGRIIEGVSPGSEIFAQDNICGQCDNASSAAATFYPYGQPLGSGFSVDDIEPMFVDTTPIDLSRFTILPSTEVEDHVLTYAGARPADRDTVDQRVADQVRNRTGSQIASEDDVGGFPVLPETRRAVTDIPGYPADDPHGDSDSDGWTNLEKWLRDQSGIVENGT